LAALTNKKSGGDPCRSINASSLPDPRRRHPGYVGRNDHESSRFRRFRSRRIRFNVVFIEYDHRNPSCRIRQRGASELLTRLCDSWSSITGQDKRRIIVSLDEVDALSRLEDGMILPDFGEEAVWARSHARELGELGRRD
jgi:hypothetical protein